jgi:UDP-N-acetyl-D-galactosamine dehydrogenase
MEMKQKLNDKEAVICVVGLGYVGLPLAVAFSNAGFKTVGFDVDPDKIKGLKNGDCGDICSRDVISDCSVLFTSDEKEINRADFVIVAVPTPVTEMNVPDLNYLKSASELVGRNMKSGAVVIFESTVYPGATEEICVPIIEKASGMKYGSDFGIGYSPERINPGDDEHKLNTITKIVSGNNEQTTDLLAELYGGIVDAGVHAAKSIKVAEAAKLIENVQRDLNIAFVNELSLIFDKMGLSTKDVLDAASTKWNFHKYSPGLVGGHCIPVDPYYLVHKAKELGYHPHLILAGRNVNNYMQEHVARMVEGGFNEANKGIKGSDVLIMGLTFKENISDFRTAPAKKIIEELKKLSVSVTGYDPHLKNSEIMNEFGINAVESLDSGKMFDCVIITIAHNHFKELSIDDIKKITKSPHVLVDVRCIFDPEVAREKGFIYRCL